MAVDTNNSDFNTLDLKPATILGRFVKVFGSKKSTVMDSNSALSSEVI